MKSNMNENRKIYKRFRNKDLLPLTNTYSTGRNQRPSAESQNNFTCATCSPNLSLSPSPWGRAINNALKGKAGVYMIYNHSNGKFYIGSSVELSARIARHTYEARHGRSQLPLYRAIRKYGLENFSLVILTFCEPVSSTCMRLEQSAIDTYNPAYNILRQAGVSTGFKHRSETIEHLRELHSGESHPRYGTEPSENQRKATSITLKRYYAQHGHHQTGKKGILAPQYGIGGKRVHLYGEDGTYLVFPSINSARLFLKVRAITISNAIDTGRKVLLRGKSFLITSKPR